MSRMLKEICTPHTSFFELYVVTFRWCAALPDTLEGKLCGQSRWKDVRTTAGTISTHTHTRKTFSLIFDVYQIIFRIRYFHDVLSAWYETKLLLRHSIHEASCPACSMVCPPRMIPYATSGSLWRILRDTPNWGWWKSSWSQVSTVVLRSSYGVLNG